MSLTTKTTIVPHLSCRNAAQAVEFYQKAFDAKLATFIQTPDAQVMHASLTIDGAEFYVVDEFPDFGGKSPEMLGGSPVTIDLRVPDCDAVFAKAVEAGCKVKIPLADMFWGDRYGQIEDPFGHSWSVASMVREVSETELKQVVDSMSETSCGPDSQ